MADHVVMVTGSRDWSDRDIIEQAIRDENPTLLVLGDARGADTLALQIANDLKIPAIVHFAQWSQYGRRAGPIRNQEMVDRNPDVCLAFPLENSRGTADAMKRAKKAGILVKVFPK